MAPGSVDRERLLAEADEFVRVVDQLYGLYLDAVSGFHKLADEITNAQTDAAQQLGLSIEELDARQMYVGRGDPNDPTSIVQHTTTQGEFKARNRRSGSNEIRLAQLLIVLIFQYWETGHRAEVAAALGLAEKSELLLPLLGDLRLLRHNVIHHRGVVTCDTPRRLEVLRGFVEGETIALSELEAEQLVRRVKAEIDNLVLTATGVDPEHRKIWHLA